MTAVSPETGTPPVPPAAEPLRLRGITKRFPLVLANDAVDLDIFPGEVHALLGENGAGKSTLMKILYGFYQPTAGTISFGDREQRIRSPQEGRALGIGMVFQSFTLVPAMTVAENVALTLPNLPFVLPRESLDAEIRALSDRYQFDIDPRSYVYELSLGERQKVEILKLLLARARFLIFDEPTSVLAPHEIEGLLEVFRRLRADGLAVLFITHKLREVLAVADRITVLRRGAVTASMPAAGATEDSLVGLMLGSGDNADASIVRRTGPSPDGDEAMLDIRSAHVPDPAGRVDLHDLSLKIRPGEVVGVAGVAGNGQVELGEFIVGLRPARSGETRLFRQDAGGWSPARRLAGGLSCVPEDPLLLGSIPAMSVLENMVLIERARFAGWGGLSFQWAAARAAIAKTVESFRFTLPALEARAQDLSGGNVQRMVFARELARSPELLVLFYPTRGMDVPSANAAREVMLSHRARGCAVLLVSEDLDELFALSDRLIVMHGGRIVGDFRPDETDAHAIGFLMTGAGHEAGAAAHG